MLDLGSACPLSDNLADGMFDILSGLMTRNDNLVVKGLPGLLTMLHEKFSATDRSA